MTLLSEPNSVSAMKTGTTGSADHAGDGGLKAPYDRVHIVRYLIGGRDAEECSKVPIRHVATLIVDGVDQAGELPSLEDVRDEKMGTYGIIGGYGLAEPAEDPVMRGFEVPGPSIGDGLGSISRSRPFSA